MMSLDFVHEISRVGCVCCAYLSSEIATDYPDDVYLFILFYFIFSQFVSCAMQLPYC